MNSAKHDTDRILRIAGRARALAKKAGVIKAPQVIDLAMSMSICHNRRFINLDKLEGFDDLNLCHDVLGIYQHVNHMTGELTDCFVPRCGFTS